MESNGVSRNVTISIWIIVLAMHCTDIKVSVVKFTEIFFLLYAIINIRDFCDVGKFFFRFFTIFLAITFVHNIFMDFSYHSNISFLKLPYLVSLGRYIEVISCLSFMEFVRRTIIKYGFTEVLNLILRINCIFCLFIFLIFILNILGYNAISVTYGDNYRVRGLFVEGGPFGLLCSIMAILGIIQKRPIKETVLIILLVFIAQSKAGIVALSAYFCIHFLRKLYLNDSYRKYFFIGIVSASIGFVFAFIYISKMYIDEINDVSLLDSYVNSHPEDYSATAGRIPATFIVPQMFFEHPLIGIGIGNYSLLRNLPEYRSFFPAIDIDDATGYGGVVDILNQCGLIGLAFFLYFIINQVRCSEKAMYITLFVLPMLCGVQYTFLYPWFFLALHSFSLYPDSEQIED